jgi:hypothetical protein
VNAPEAFRLRLQSLVARGLAATAIAGRVGLAAASEVWGGERPRDRAAWYLWLRDAPGAWQLELAAAEALASAGPAAIVARFTVRHYPSPASPVLGRFSAEERRIAAEALDGTGTPRIELASGIPDALFTVGSVEWALDLAGDAAVIGLATLDRLRTRSERGDVVRDVPGWELTAPVFSLLAGLYAQVEGRAASRLVLSRQPGFELLAGDPDHRDAPDRALAEAFVVFPSAGAAGASGTLLEALRDPEAELLADASFEPGAHPPHRVGGDGRVGLPVNPAWFGGGAYVADRLACTC